MYIPDPIERGEMRAEHWGRELNCRDGEIDCVECGKRINLGDSHMISNDPWGPPCCGDCLDKFISEHQAQS